MRDFQIWLGNDREVQMLLLLSLTAPSEALKALEKKRNIPKDIASATFSNPPLLPGLGVLSSLALPVR